MLDYVIKSKTAETNKVHGIIEDNFPGPVLWCLIADDLVAVRASDPPHLHHVVREVYVPPRGAVAEFTLVASPQRRVKGHRMPLPGDDARMAWVIRRLAERGLDVLDVGVSNGETFINRRKEGAGPFTIPRCIFKGEARVRDHEILAESMAFPVGRGRAYGMGMLMFKRP